MRGDTVISLYFLDQILSAFLEVRIDRFLNIQIVALTTPYTRVITDQNNTRTVSGTDHDKLMMGILADKFSH